MQRSQALLVVLLLAACTVGLLAAPWWLLAVAVPAALVGLRQGRRSYAAFVLVTWILNVTLFVWLVPEGRLLQVAGVQIDAAAWTATVATLRLSALLGTNLAVLSRVQPARLLDGLGLPLRTTALLGAVLIAAHDAARDGRRLLDARRLEQGWPRHRLAALRSAATLLPALVVAAVRRAAVRRDALVLAGQSTRPWFVPLVAITALGVAGRLAFLALPNIALTYVVVFAGGLVFGARIGILAGLLSMALTDLALSGFLPSGFANAAAMALVGAAGGLLGRVDFGGASRSDRAVGMALAAATGVFATLLFSLVADALSWAMVAEFRADMRLLWGRMALGLAFNVVPAIANGILFAACVGPLQEAVRALGWPAPGTARHRGMASTAAVPAGPAVK